MLNDAPDAGALRHGALRCLQMFATDELVDAQHLPHVLRLLLPAMLQVAVAGAAEGGDREAAARAVAVFRACAHWCALAHQHALLGAELDSWCQLLLAGAKRAEGWR